MKILFYTNNINPTFGGSVFSLQILVKELLKLNVEVKVIINRHHEKEIDIGAPVIALNAKYGDLQRPFQLRKIVRQEKPDAIFASMKPMMITLGIARLLSPGSRTIFAGIERMADHGLFYLEKWRFIPRRLFIRLSYGLLDHIVAISEFVRQDLHETYWLPLEQISVIYNAAELEVIREKSRHPLPDKDARLFDDFEIMINVGRLTTQKAQHHLINILALLKEQRPNLHLLILGEGKLENDLLALARQQGLEDRVHLLGHRDNPFAYIAKAKLFALTSIHEAFGRVVLESMVIGTPVVAFDARGGHVELLADGAGIVVPQGDEQAFAKIVLSILEDESFREKLIGQAMGRSDEFGAEKHAQTYVDCVERLKNSY